MIVILDGTDPFGHQQKMVNLDFVAKIVRDGEFIRFHSTLGDEILEQLHFRSEKAATTAFTEIGRAISQGEGSATYVDRDGHATATR